MTNNSKTRDQRLKALALRSAPDHRTMHPDYLYALRRQPRKTRRLQKKIINDEYSKAVRRLRASHMRGAGYPGDRQLRTFAQDYNSRSLGHGLSTLPGSFNVIEGFLDFRKDGPVNTFTIRPERDHVFSMEDFLDFATTAQSSVVDDETINNLPEGIIHHYSQIGDIKEFSFLDADREPYVIASFSVVRHGSDLHWMLVGGTVCDLQAITHKMQQNPRNLSEPPKSKRGLTKPDTSQFFANPLDGTSDVWKSIVYGRFNLSSRRHEVRSVSQDVGGAYEVQTDDPTIYDGRHENRLTNSDLDSMDGMMRQIEKDRLPFELMECCLSLPAYFAFRISITRTVEKGTEIGRLSNKAQFDGLTRNVDQTPTFKIVTSLEIKGRQSSPVIRQYSPPRYQVEVDGYWRKLHPGAPGVGPNGTPEDGRTWIPAHFRWKDKPARTRPILIKSSVSAAKIEADMLLASMDSADNGSANVIDDGDASGWLYVMRYPLADQEIYKIGWTARSPQERANELSRASGVPLSLIVVESWMVERPREVEKLVHAALASHRLNRRKEFFRAPFLKVRAHVLAAITQCSGRNVDRR